MSERRRFNGRERIALYLASGGRCAVCGAPLERGWHADHVVPYVAGGRTDVVNGQALCAACNISKGERMESTSLPIDDEGLPQETMRQWQREAAAKYVLKSAADFLVSATPGAGKTRFAVKVAADLLRSRVVSKLVVVVPTSSLRHQWAIAAQKHFGMQLDDGFLNRHFTPAADFDGVVVTYQQVAANPLIFRRLVAQERTFVIFDEIHHAGDGKGWGDALREAFSNATRRICVSGTPFRGDNKRIPFVEYDRDGKCVIDWSYSYGDALRDSVCRPVYFHTYGGEIHWEDEAGEHTHVLGDEADERTNSKAMRAALSLESRWLPEVIQLADRRLLSVRENEFPDAAGLVIARDQRHAFQIAAYMEKALGERPFVVVSDNPDDDTPTETIHRFSKGDPDPYGDIYARIPRWIVAVKMISEGVDIPRLTVGVYATNVISELFFRQAIGRFVRMVLDGLSAYLFLPAHPELSALAQRITEEVEHAIEEVEQREASERKERLSGDTIDEFSALPSQVDAREIIAGGAAYSRLEFLEAREHRRRIASMHVLSDEQVMVIIHDLKAAGLWRDPEYQQAEIRQQQPVERPTLREEKERLKKRIRQLVAKVIAVTEMDHQEVYRRLMIHDGMRQTEATNDQLRGRIDLLKSWLEAEDGRYAS